MPKSYSLTRFHTFTRQNHLRTSVNIDKTWRKNEPTDKELIRIYWDIASSGNLNPC